MHALDLVATDDLPILPARPGAYAYGDGGDDDETPVDHSHRYTPSARPAMSQAEANLLLIEQALLAIKRNKTNADTIDDLEELVIEARRAAAVGRD